MGNPAESANPGLLAVGAADWATTDIIKPYSSRGPTPDGRIKPDIVGATCGETSQRPLNSFRNGYCGTSQASAHVAGMAALMRQWFPNHSPVQVAGYLKDNAAQRESPDPNNTWGHGFAQLPAPPVIEPACATGGAVTNADDNPGLVSDCEVLLAARNTLEGTGTLDWSESTPIADWDGVTLGGTPQRVTDLYLTNKGLTGTIPAVLGNLAKLESLDLQSNQLSGEILPQLGNLANLTGLYLSGNRLSGEIPAELGSLANLEELYLSGNELTGGIPVELGRLANLTVLELGVNQLTGGIPVELGNLANLTALGLGGNELTGGIPVELGNLANLTLLRLSANELSGEIPRELGNLASLVHLDLGANELSGEIPAELGNLANLGALLLGMNQLSGEIPADLGSLADLKELYLSVNELTGGIPVELGHLANLGELSLGENQLNGEIPPELGNLANLEVLLLQSNQLSGEIPAELGDLANLERLWLSRNQLTGCVPAALRDVPNNDIDQLSLDFCAGLPGAPTGLTAMVSESEAQVELSWTAPGDDGGAPITGYWVESSVDGNDPWVEVHTTTGGSTSYTDDGTDSNGPMFEVGTTRYYRVAAINSAGAGPFSDPRHAGGDPLVARYDANNNGMVDRGEVITAIREYLTGVGDITRSEVIQLIRLYLTG